MPKSLLRSFDYFSVERLINEEVEMVYDRNHYMTKGGRFSGIWYEEKSRADYQHLSSSLVFSRMILKARDYQIYLPREVVIFFRTLVIADMVAVKLAPGFDILRALNLFFESYPLGVAEELIVAKTHDPKLETVTDPAAHLSFEELLEVKEAEREKLGAAKERLINIVAAYAEDYEEIRQLLKA